MRKILLASILISLVVVFSVSAKTSSGSLVFKGFYEVQQSSVTLDITDASGGSVLLNYVDIPDTSLSASVKIFDWSLTGTATSSKATATVTFTFSPMQALLDGLYCVPAYTITMTKNSSMVGTKTVTDNFKISGSSSFSVEKQEVENSENPNGFTKTNAIKYTGSFASNQTGTWVRSGSCSIRITDYKQDFVGDFKYTGEVKVEVTAN